ncbi:MAG TPA: hypothetical protein ENN69_01720, partial [Spirochaetia bacterium]|nr:hypothetical protein [Spirochaetia bacterium]
MVLVQLIQIFIVGGFFVIAVAPVVKIYGKAGKPGWLAMIPGANAWTMARLAKKQVLTAGLVSLLAVPVFLVVIGAVGFSGSLWDDLSAVLSLILVTALFSLLIPYP